METDPNFIEQIKMAGFMVYPAILLAGVAVTMGGVGVILSLTKHSVGRILGFCGLGGAALVLLIGFAGRAMGMQQVERAVVNVEPEMRERIMAQGALEAGYNVSLAGEFATLPALLGMLAVGLGVSRGKPTA